jgi:hypothetical protein
MAEHVYNLKAICERCHLSRAYATYTKTECTGAALEAASVEGPGLRRASTWAVHGKVRERYVSSRLFGELVVMPELLSRGLCTREGGLTEGGRKSVAELELRMAGALREIKAQRGDWVIQQPREALMAAALAVCAGRGRRLQDLPETVNEDAHPEPGYQVPPAATPDYSLYDWRFMTMMDFHSSSLSMAPDSSADCTASSGPNADEAGTGDCGDSGDGGGDGGDGGDGGGGWD